MATGVDSGRWPTGTWGATGLRAEGRPLWHSDPTQCERYTRFFLCAVLLGLLIATDAARPAPLHATPVLALDTAGDVGRYTAIALDGAGRPVIAYTDATNARLKVFRCGTPSCTSGNTVATPDTSNASVGWDVSLTLDAAGNPVVAYSDSSNSNLKVLHCGNASCTSGNTITTPDSAGIVGTYTSIALDALGRPVVSYHASFPTSELRVLRCGDASCTSGNTITTPAMSGLFTSLALDSAGNPIVSYYDDTDGSTNGELSLLRCGDASCSAGNTVNLVDGVTGAGRFSSLELDGSDRPVISYISTSLGGTMKVAHCGDPACGSSIAINTLDSANGVGAYTSLELDGLGNPVVTYYDYGNKTSSIMNGDLRVARCADADCAAVASIEYPDIEGEAGRYSSLALDSLGNPVIGYYSGSEGDLRFIHCANSSCRPKTGPAAPDTIGNAGEENSYDPGRFRKPGDRISGRKS